MSNLATVLMLVGRSRHVNSALKNNSVINGDWHVYNILRECLCACFRPGGSARYALARKTWVQTATT